MSIRDFLTAALFKNDDAGRTVIYPNGVMGRGYIVTDPARVESMRTAMMWTVIGSGVLGGVGMQLLVVAFGQVHTWNGLPWMIAMAALIGFGLAYQVVVRAMTRGMAPVELRMSIAEALRRQAQAMPGWYLWMLVIFAPLLAIGSALWMVTEPTLTSILVGPLGVALFSVATMQAVYGMMWRRRS